MNIIKKAIKSREDEIYLFGVNIFNYEHAAAKIANEPELQKFKSELLERARVERLEMRKSELILNALKAQQKTQMRWIRRILRFI